MDENKKQTINHYVYVAITSLVTLATLILYFILFTGNPENFEGLVLLVLILTWLCFMMVYPLVVPPKKEVAKSKECNGENVGNENLVKDLQNELIDIKKNLSDFKLEDFEKIQLEKSKTLDPKMI